MRKRALIAYYSYTGRTGQLARALASSLDAADHDLEEIVEVRLRRGWSGGLRAAAGAMLRRATPIALPLHPPDEYEVVLIGTPIWMGRVATPMRTYLQSQSFGDARLGVFSTSGGPVQAEAMAEIARLAGGPIAARLHLVGKGSVSPEQIQGFLEDLGLPTLPATTTPAIRSASVNGIDIAGARVGRRPQASGAGRVRR